MKAPLKTIPLFLAMAGIAGAVGTVTSTLAQIGTSQNYVLTYSWTADASAGTIPATSAALLVSTMPVQGMFILAVETIPGSPAPTNLYSVAVKDDSGFDVLNGTAAAAVSSTNAQGWTVATSVGPLNGSLTLAVTGNLVNSAQGIVKVFLGKNLLARGGSGGSGGGGTVTQVNNGTGITGGPITTSGAIGLASIADADILANISGATAAPIPNTLSATLDHAFAATQGGLLYRGASLWSFLGPGTANQCFLTGGAAANPSWQNCIVLTTTGSSGAATYTASTNTLNVPNYGAGSGYAITSPNGTLSLSGCTPPGPCTADVAATVSAPAFAASITCAWAAPAYTCAPAALTGNVTTFTNPGLVAGKTPYTLIWTQNNSTTQWNITYPANFIGFCQPWPENNVKTVITFYYDGTNANAVSCGTPNANELFFSGPTRSAPGTPTASSLTGWFDSTNNVLKIKDSSANVTQTVVATGTGNKVQCADTLGIPCLIASGTAALGTSAIASGLCATVVTATATGAATSDAIIADPNTDPTAVTGYAPSASGSLYIWKWATANTVNFKVCNNTSGSITPAALTLNWRVVR